MHSENIIAAINAGNLTAAEHLCRQGLLGQPDDEDLSMLLAMSLQLQNRTVDAVSAYAHLVALFPDNSAYWANYATVLHESGQLREAEDAYGESTRLDPANPFPLIHKGIMLIERHDYLAAREMLLDAFDLDKRSTLARIHAARACALCQDFNGAQDLVRPWREWLPLHDDELQIALSRLLLQLSDVTSAHETLEDLVQRNSANSEIRLLLARVYERMNKLPEAKALAISVAADNSLSDFVRKEVDHLFAKLAMRGGDAAKARSMYEMTGERHSNDYSHYFELAEAYDKLNKRDLAMKAWQKAHALQVEELKIASAEHFLPDAFALPADVPEASMATYQQWPDTLAPDTRHSPIFIVGFPRSGTTLLEQMLDAHPALQSMDENPFFNRLADKLRQHDPRILDNLGALEQRDCDELRRLYLLMVSERINRRWDAQLVDKNPLNMLWLSMIYRLFPQAKFILALRHPCDVVLSCYTQNFRSSIVAAASSNLKRLAQAYVQAMECWLKDAQIFQPNVLVSRYEELVADFPQQTSRLAEFLELQDAAPMMKFDQHARNKSYIATPSYSQVIVPVNRKGMNRWHRYRAEFEPILPILEPMLRQWGYAAE